ncbi:MAG: hypothetical protein ABIR54_17905 [Burkholderiaceae bacterium]
MKQSQYLPTLSILCVSVLALSACGALRSSALPDNAEPASSQAGRTVATPQSDGRTAEGGFVDGFSFAEKPGDVALNPVSFSSGTARATGAIDPRHGSTWGGIALTTSLSRGGRALDAKSVRTLAISLASPVSEMLRVRLVGPNAAFRDSGCYPVAMVRVVPDLKEYAIPIASFAPESYCGPNAPAGPAAAAALTAVEVADAAVTPGRRRQVDFTIGVIRVMP